MAKIKTLEEVRKYIDKEYWEAGTKSGYKDTDVCNWWWVNRWLQCFTQVIGVSDKRVLDLGCAMGGFVAGLLTWGADACGIDISDYAIRKGKEKLSYLNDRIFQGSCHDLSGWPSEFFDVIYSNQVFEHIPE
ncbi:MAG: class I SAM-dependent methyltransferase, partial [bacterium]